MCGPYIASYATQVHHLSDRKAYPMSLSPDSTDRRTNNELRLRFLLVFEVLKPYFDASNQWAGQSHEHFAYRAVKERFPELSAQDCFIAVATAKRMIANGVMPA